MKAVLCFGDSNTWGFNPSTGGRYPLHVRWPGVLQEQLGPGFRVVEEGLNGRTTAWDDPVAEVMRNGRRTLPVCLESHKPIDLVLIMLGTNDLKTRFSTGPADVAMGAALLLDMVRRSESGPDLRAPEVLLINPAHIGEEPGFDGVFGQAREKSMRLGEYYEREAGSRAGCHFFDAATIVDTSPLDGVHLSAEAHGMLGRALADLVYRILTRETGETA